MKASVDLTLDRVFGDGEGVGFIFTVPGIPWRNAGVILDDRVLERSLRVWPFHTPIRSWCPWRDNPWLWQRTEADETVSLSEPSPRPWDAFVIISESRDRYPWIGHR